MYVGGKQESPNPTQPNNIALTLIGVGVRASHNSNSFNSSFSEWVGHGRWKNRACEAGNEPLRAGAVGNQKKITSSLETKASENVGIYTR